MRIDHGMWRHFGPVLVGALGPKRRRSEDHELVHVEEGEEVTVAIREVRGEVAQLSCELRLGGASGQLLDTAPARSLDSRSVVVLRGIAERRDRLWLCVDGYFERTMRPVDGYRQRYDP